MKKRERRFYSSVVAGVLSAACLSWIEENVEIEPWQRVGERRVGIDPSVAEALREALTEEGFVDDEADSMEG